MQTIARGRAGERVRHGHLPRALPATPRSCPRPTASCVAGSPTSRTASVSGSSPSAFAAPVPALTGEAGAADRALRRAAELDAELAELQAALVADGLDRVAWGELQDLRWQVETFGFHLASLEVRQHSAVHRAALEALARGGDRRRAELRARA